MKISELPQDVKEKALEYQKNENSKIFSKTTDDLGVAFDWQKTEECDDYWLQWLEAPATIIKMYSEEDVSAILSKLMTDISKGNSIHLPEWFNKFNK